jgi:leader peptidase (prepilin peptidase)/N-methyltransferase
MGLALEGLFALVVATALGSFLGTVGFRLAEDFRAGGAGWAVFRLMSGRSICACGARALTIAELIPLVGFLAGRGRCRTCAVKLPSMEPAAEASAMIGAALALLAGATALEALLFGAAVATAVVLAWIDLDQGFLPDVLLLALAALGVALAAVTPEMGSGWQDRALAAAIGGGALYGLRWIWRRWRGVEAVGLGDVKLFGVIGLWVGVTDLPIVVTVGAAVTLAGALSVGKIDRAQAVPLGPGMLAALIAVALWRAAPA